MGQVIYAEEFEDSAPPADQDTADYAGPRIPRARTVDPFGLGVLGIFAASAVAACYVIGQFFAWLLT
jgi:hypothetical protein